ncbi:MAG: hypothetical protein ACK4PR_08730 [Gammaproteobacteria bacterium]
MEYTVTELCGLLDISTSGYYYWCTAETSKRAERDSKFKQKIIEIHHSSKSRYGSPRVMTIV